LRRCSNSVKLQCSRTSFRLSNGTKHFRGLKEERRPADSIRERSFMTRIASLTAFAIIICGFSYGAPRPEASTYVDGNISALKPNTGGTLLFRDNESMLFKTGGAEVSVPYTSIHKAELGASQTHSQEAPLYKVWSLPKRLHKNETQLLTLEFKNKT